MVHEKKKINISNVNCKTLAGSASHLNCSQNYEALKALKLSLGHFMYTNQIISPSLICVTGVLVHKKKTKNLQYDL